MDRLLSQICFCCVLVIQLGIYMKNCVEWVLAEQGVFCLSGATVPLYDTLGPDSVEVSAPLVLHLGRFQSSYLICFTRLLPHFALLLGNDSLFSIKQVQKVSSPPEQSLKDYVKLKDQEVAAALNM